MKISIIPCDRCGRAIQGYPVQISTRYTKRDKETVLQDGPSWTHELDGNVFCVYCARDVVNYMKNSINLAGTDDRGESSM
ncbi:MAG: hypothetical protein ACI4R5_04515 [Acetatifactor sp.]